MIILFNLFCPQYLKSFLQLLSFILFFFVLSTNTTFGEPLQLQLIDFSTPISLDGSWQFHVGDNPQWKNPNHDDQNWQKIQVPLAWEKQGHSQTRIGWYRYTFHLNAPNYYQPIGINLGIINDSDETYLNGKLIGKTGVFPPRNNSLFGKQRIYYLPSEFINFTGKNVIAIKVWHAPYNNYGGGIFAGQTALMNYDTLRNNYYLEELIKIVFALICIFIGFYHLPLYFRRPSSNEYLWYFWSCIIIGIYGLMRTQIRFELIDNFLLIKKIETLTLFLIPYFCLKYFYQFFNWEKTFFTKLTNILIFSFIIAEIPADLPLSFLILKLFNYFMIIEIIYFTVKIIKEVLRQSDLSTSALIIALGAFIFAIFSLNDILINSIGLYRFKSLGDTSLLAIGFFSIISSMAISLSFKFTELQKLATTDGLTGLNTHMHFHNQLQLAIETFFKTKKPLTLVMIDIDHFKNINDHYGHLAGDALISQIAILIKNHFHLTNNPSRYGGDEFAVILLNTNTQKAYSIVEKFRQQIEKLEVTYGNQQLKITVSIGLAEFGQNTYDKNEFIKEADTALYLSKNKGRNRITVSNQQSCSQTNNEFAPLGYY